MINEILVPEHKCIELSRRVLVYKQYNIPFDRQVTQEFDYERRCYVFRWEAKDEERG